MSGSSGSWLNQYFYFYRPQTKFVKVMFLHLSFSHSVHRERCGGGDWYPSIPCRSPGPHPGGRLRGLGGVSRPTPGRGVSRPTPRGCLPSCMLGCIPPRSRGTPLGPETRGRHSLPPRYGQQAGGTHPTGMHSFGNIFIKRQVLFNFRIL